MKKSPALVFFGTEHFSAPSLQALIDTNYEIAYVVTKPDSPRGRGRVLESPEVKKIAEAHHIPVLQPIRLVDIEPQLAQLESPVGVLVAYGKIIPQTIIDLFTPGIINVHPSLLPVYRGPSPIEAAILNGDNETGISIMQLSAAMDAGPVYRQTTYPLSGFETKTELYELFAQNGALLLTETLPNILSGKLSSSPQDDTRATYCSLLKKDDGVMDTEHKTAETLEREVRAYLGFPKSRTTIYNQHVIVTKAHTPATSNDQLVLACLDNTTLAIDKLIAPSGKKMNAEAFIRGYSR